MEVKIYSVTTPDDRLIAVKLTRAAAQAVARIFAPAKIVPLRADKVEAVTSINTSSCWTGQGASYAELPDL